MFCSECKAKPDNPEDVVCKANIRRLIMTRDGGRLGCLNNEETLAHRMLDLFRESKPFYTAYVMFCFGIYSVSMKAVSEASVANLLKIADEYAEAFMSQKFSEVYDGAYIRKEFNPSILDFDQVSDFVDDRIQKDRRFAPKRIVTMECSQCGQEFHVQYLPDGTYNYMESPCDCEADFYPAEGEPSISEWLNSLF